MRSTDIPIRGLDEDVLDAFDRHLSKCRCEPPRGAHRDVALTAIRHFLRYLRKIGAAPVPALAKYVEAPYFIAFYRVGPVAPHVDGFATFLDEQRYAYDSALMHLSAVRHLGHWMAAQRLRVEELHEGVVDAFDAHLCRCRCAAPRRGRSSGAATGARHFLRYLRERGVAPPRNVAPPPVLIDEYCRWMKAHRGVGESTLVHHRRYLGRFLAFAGDDPSRFDPRLLRKFTLTLKAAKKNALSALRAFVRFLVATGRCRPGIEDAIPALAQWRLSSLPRYLPSKDVERIVATAPVGSRDRAALLLMARLGLRRADVAALTLQDIDWKKGVVRVVGKSRREGYLPLPQDVGNAILAYVQRERPKTGSDRVFMSSIAPVRPISPHTVSGLTHWAIRRAGIPSPSRGCHLLRHSAATMWLRQGLSMREIGILLRHQHLQTTEIYAKVDVSGLRRIAQSWPRSTR
jgi:integrase/recombinase XerD